MQYPKRWKRLKVECKGPHVFMLGWNVGRLSRRRNPAAWDGDKKLQYHDTIWTAGPRPALVLQLPLREQASTLHPKREFQTKTEAINWLLRLGEEHMKTQPAKTRKDLE